MTTDHYDPIPVLEIDTSSEGHLICMMARVPPSSSASASLQESKPTRLLVPLTNPALLHDSVTHAFPLSDVTTAKLTGLHLGQDSFDTHDLTALFLLLERRLRLFASQIPEFHSLSQADQEGLILSNSPMYFQLSLACYINAANGFQQLRFILGPDAMPEALMDLSDALLTVTFSYFNDIVALFTDRLWEDLYDMMLRKLHRLSALVSENESAMGYLVACIVFHQMSPSKADDDFDDPDLIARAWGKYARELCGGGHCSRKPGLSSGYEVAQHLSSLRSMAAFYSAHANIYRGDFPSAAVAISADDREWLESQICCLETAWQHVGLTDMFAAYPEQPDAADACSLSVEKLEGLIRRRMATAVSAFTDFDWAVKMSEEGRERNVENATSLVFLILEAVTETGAQQLAFVLSQEDKLVWSRSACMLPSMRKVRFQVARTKATTYFLAAKEAFRQGNIFALTCLMLLNQSDCCRGLQVQERLQNILGKELSHIFGEVTGTAFFVHLIAAIYQMKIN